VPTKEELERAAPRDRGGDVHLRSAPQMHEYAVAVERIVADGPGRLLDWGCGYGHLSHMLALRGVDVTSVEWHPTIPEGTVRPAERYDDVTIRYTQEPVALPYEDASFDTILSMGVLEHVQHPDASLRELWRILRPGGRLYVHKLANRFSYLEAVARRAGFYYHGQLEFDRVYTRASARALVEGAGFDVQELHLANVLALGLTAGVAQRPGFVSAWWRANRALARVPGLNLVATNIDLVARRPA
jgi:2-polyprenyl-3-methyl-5-hydroxy-6-metoxy-1,4-benzoquinol methylase